MVKSGSGITRSVSRCFFSALADHGIASLTQIIDNAHGVEVDDLEIEEAAAKASKKSKSKLDTTNARVTLSEIGPRFVLVPVKIFEGSFGGATLYENKGASYSGNQTSLIFARLTYRLHTTFRSAHCTKDGTSWQIQEQKRGAGQQSQQAGDVGGQQGAGSAQWGVCLIALSLAFPSLVAGPAISPKCWAA